MPPCPGPAPASEEGRGAQVGPTQGLQTAPSSSPTPNCPKARGRETAETALSPIADRTCGDASRTGRPEPAGQARSGPA